MRTLMRVEIDPSRPIDLASLKGFERITVAVRYKFITSSFYQKYKNKELDKQAHLLATKKENLKNVILYHLTQQLQKKANVGSVTLFVDRSFEDVLQDVLHSMDFSGYTIYKKKENPDVLLVHPEMKICLIAERRKFDSCETTYDKISLTGTFGSS